MEWNGRELKKEGPVETVETVEKSQPPHGRASYEMSEDAMRGPIALEEDTPGVILRLWLAVVRWTLRRTAWCLITEGDIDAIAQMAFTSGCALGRKQRPDGLLAPRTPRYLEHERRRGDRR